MIVVCGKNEKLAARLRAQRWSTRVHVVGFTREVNRLMHAADFLIGKPGPGSIAEAMISGLPVLVECNSGTLPQERYNTEWVREKGVGVVVRNFRSDVVGAVKTFLDPNRLEGMKKNVSALHNRAVFEIPEFLASLLAEGESNHREVSSGVTAAS